MSRLVIDNTVGAIRNEAGSEPVRIQDNNGLTIRNEAVTFSANLNATAATELTLTGSFLIVNDSGLTIKNTAATRSIAVTATGTTELTFGGTTVASGVTASDLTAARVVISGTAGRLTTSAALLYDSATGRLTTGRLNVNSSTLSSTGDHAADFTATLPNLSSSETGIAATITLNGTGSGVTKRGLRLALNAGTYTDASSTIALDVNSLSVGTGVAQNIPTAGSSGPGNKGLYVLTNGSTVGTNIGGYFEALNGAVSIGVIGKCVSSSGVTSSVGVIGAAIDTGSTNSIGVFATMNMTSDPPYSGHGKCALVVDNGTGLVADVAHFSSQSAHYMKIKNLGPIELRTDPLASGVLNWDQQYAMTASSADETSMYRRVASAGTTSSGIKSGEYVFLDAGYTGAGTMNGIYLRHDAAGTGADLRLNTNGNLPLGNIGLYSATNGSTTTGYNVSVYGSPRQGLKNFGVIGRAVVSTNATHNVGLMGSAINASSANVGVFAGLAVGDNPTLTTAALLVNNGSTAAPIAIFQDNGTTKLLIDDGGIVTHIPTLTTSNAFLGTYSYPNTSNVIDAFRLDLSPSAGTNPTELYGFTSNVNGGFTGSAQQNAVRGVLASASTGTNINLGSSADLVSTSVWGITAASGVGTAVGLRGNATGSAAAGKGYGVIGVGARTHASATNIGVMGVAHDTAGNVRVGGYFGLTLSEPTFTSAALIANNGAVSAPIALFQTGGSTKLTVESNGRLTQVIGTLVNGTSAQSVTATLGTSAEIGILETITSAGSGGEQIAHQITIAAGFSGTSGTEGLRVINNTDGAGVTPFGTGANYGVYSEATGSSNTGTNVGSFNRAGGSGNGTNHWGLIALADGGGTNPNNIAVLGVANGGAIRIGGYFYLGTGQPTLTVSSALTASNGSVAASIFEARDNNTLVLKIDDGGITTYSAGTVATTVNAWTNTATMTSSAGDEVMLLDNITPAGSSSGNKIARRINVNPGFTGAGSSIGLEIINGCVGVGVSLKLATDAYPEGNIGSYIKAEAATATGYNIGFYGAARLATRNYGVIGKCVTTSSVTQNVGTIGIGFGASSVNVGVFAGMNCGDNPTLTSCALLADNGSNASPIFVARDNGTAKFTIGDGGLVTHSPTLGANETAHTLTATLSSTAAHQKAAYINISSGGSAAGDQTALLTELQTGYTGANATSGVRVLNGAAGTGTDIVGDTANYGVRALTNGSTAGAQAAIYGSASGASTGLRVGVLGFANNGSSGTGAGVVGLATSVGTRTGGWFSLSSATPTVDVTAALVADNFNVAAPIFVARDNGTTKFSLEDGGSADFHKIASANLTFENRTTDISSPVQGLAYWQSSTKKLRVYDGSAWVDINSSGSGITGTLASGEIVYATGTSTTDSDVQFKWDTSTKKLLVGNGAGTTSALFDLGTQPVAGTSLDVRAVARVATALPVFSFSAASAGSDSTPQLALNVVLNEGHTGTGSASALTSEVLVDTAGGLCTGVSAIAGAISTFTNTATYMGLRAQAYTDAGGPGGLVYAVRAEAIGDNNASTYVGVLGTGSAASSPVATVGGVFSPNDSYGTLASAALIADTNGSGYPILILQDGVTPKLTFSSTGAITGPGFSVTSSVGVDITCTGGSSDMALTSSGHVLLKLGDNAGSKAFEVRDSGNVNQFSVTSDGDAVLGRNLSMGLAIYTPFVYSSNLDATKPGFGRGVMAATTTNATVTKLAFDDGATSFLDVGTNNTLYIQGTLVARSTSGESHSWKIEGLFNNAAGTLTDAGNPASVTGTFFSTGASTWVAQVEVNDTDDRVYVKVTGAAATTITWVFTVDFVTLTN